MKLFLFLVVFCVFYFCGTSASEYQLDDALVWENPETGKDCKFQLPMEEKYLPLVALEGLCHAHSNYSDGTRSIVSWRHEIQNRGLDFLILSDHGYQIDWPEKVITGIKISAGRYGINNYINDCRRNSDNCVTIWPAMEMGKRDHFLMVLPDPMMFIEKWPILKEEMGREDAEGISAYSAVSDGWIDTGLFIAHPDLRLVSPDRNKPLGDFVVNDSSFHYQGRGIFQGFEIFNNGNCPDQDSLKTNLDWFFHKDRFAGFAPIIVAGCDSHGPIEDNDEWARAIKMPLQFSDKLKRVTGIIFSQEDIPLFREWQLKLPFFEATYASYGGIRLAFSNVLHGYRPSFFKENVWLAIKLERIPMDYRGELRLLRKDKGWSKPLARFLPKNQTVTGVYHDRNVEQNKYYQYLWALIPQPPSEESFVLSPFSLHINEPADE